MITMLTVHNSRPSWAVWLEAWQEPSCYFLHLVLIARWFWLPQNIPHLAICTNSPKAPRTFRFASNHPYGNRVLASIVQPLYWQMVEFKVCFFDIWKVPTTIEGWPQNRRQCRYSNEYTEHWQICRNSWLTCISIWITSQTQLTQWSCLT